MVEHDKTGLLFEPGNTTSLAEQILRFREHPDLAKELGAAARAHALMTFSISEHARKIQLIYEQLISERVTQS